MSAMLARLRSNSKRAFDIQVPPQITESTEPIPENADPNANTDQKNQNATPTQQPAQPTVQPPTLALETLAENATPADAAASETAAGEQAESGSIAPRTTPRSGIARWDLARRNSNASKPPSLIRAGSGLSSHMVLTDHPPEGRKQSLVAPSEEGAASTSPTSRRSSVISRRSIDFSKLQLNAGALKHDSDDSDDEDDGTKFSNNDSYIRSAIPYLPLPAAAICCLLNIVAPGTGTLLSGFMAICVGRTRVENKEKNYGSTLCVNIWVGISQMFTIVFLLIGWYWSIAWGCYMIILSKEYQREERKRRAKVLQARALNAFRGFP